MRGIEVSFVYKYFKYEKFSEYSVHIMLYKVFKVIFLEVFGGVLSLRCFQEGRKLAD